MAPRKQDRHSQAGARFGELNELNQFRGELADDAFECFLFVTPPVHSKTRNAARIGRLRLRPQDMPARTAVLSIADYNPCLRGNVGRARVYLYQKQRPLLGGV